MKIVSIMWSSYINMLLKAGKKLGVELKVYSTRSLEEHPEKVEEALHYMNQADVILLCRTSDMFRDGIEKRLKNIKKPIVCVGHDPSYWLLSNVNSKIVANCYSYFIIGGEENFLNLIKYIGKEVLNLNYEVNPPKELPWEGIYHPDKQYFEDIEQYLAWYSKPEKPLIGILFSRISWIDKNLAIENALIRELEKRDLGVIPAFSYSLRDEGIGAKGMAEVIQSYFFKDGKPIIQALIKLIPFLIDNASKDEKNNSNILKKLNVPVFEPVLTPYKSIEEWENGELNNEIGWSIAMPEFEGVIEPIIIGSTKEERIAIEERCGKVAERIRKWVMLRNKPVEKRKVAFILHNNPCAGVEASVGGAAHLDSLESVARILKRMKEKGYKVEAPENGKHLITHIMEKKAISEFRWTPVEEIVKRGGALALINKEEYEAWFNTLSSKVRQKLIEAWGEPPGEAMVYENSIVVTGICLGNAIVCVQPKRGCYGARCDGQVCKILHDPDIPPTHQYLATYNYIENIFKADVIVHVGTHGNLEFLPGKGVGLSCNCYPDIAIGSMPHLYIYNADNPAEGIIAKRRSYACLIDHMQVVMTQGELYEELEELDRLLEEYENAKHDKARAHALEHLIIESIKKIQA